MFHSSFFHSYNYFLIFNTQQHSGVRLPFISILKQLIRNQNYYNIKQVNQHAIQLVLITFTVRSFEALFLQIRIEDQKSDTLVASYI